MYDKSRQVNRHQVTDQGCQNWSGRSASHPICLYKVAEVQRQRFLTAENRVENFAADHFFGRTNAKVLLAPLQMVTS